MKREDIQYFNSWGKAFEPASPSILMRAILEGIWVNSNKDPEDIYLVYPKIIAKDIGPIADVSKQFNRCPFELVFEDSETYELEKISGKRRRKSRMISGYGTSWTLDKYELRKAITRIGLKKAKENKITKEEVEALYKKYGWDDAGAYEELMDNRHDLTIKSKDSDYTYPAISDREYRYIRAAFIPHCDTLYNWMDYPEKADIHLN